jgi:hypothetical protein
MEGTKKSKL